MPRSLCRRLVNDLFCLNVLNNTEEEQKKRGLRFPALPQDTHAGKCSLGEGHCSETANSVSPHWHLKDKPHIGSASIGHFLDGPKNTFFFSFLISHLNYLNLNIPERGILYVSNLF